MGQNTRQLLQLVLIVLIFTSVMVWATPLRISAGVWTIRILTPLASGAMGWVVFAVCRSPGEHPDHVRQAVGRYFEREGFCFLPRFEVRNGAPVLCVYFQNRHAREATATIAMQLAVRSFHTVRDRLPRVEVQVRCPGVAFGVARLAYPVGAEYAGKPMRFEVAADVSYPARRGALVRMHGGRRVGPTANLSQGTRLLKALGGLLFFGILHEEHPASAVLLLPASSPQANFVELPPTVDIIWEPVEPPTPAARAAA